MRIAPPHPRPPHHPLGPRRGDRHGQPGAALPLPSPRGARRRLAGGDGRAGSAELLQPPGCAHALGARGPGHRRPVARGCSRRDHRQAPWQPLRHPLRGYPCRTPRHPAHRTSGWPAGTAGTASVPGPEPPCGGASDWTGAGQWRASGGKGVVAASTTGPGRPSCGLRQPAGRAADQYPAALSTRLRRGSPRTNRPMLSVMRSVSRSQKRRVVAETWGVMRTLGCA